METSTEVKSEQVVEGHNNTYIGILAGKSQDYQDGYYSGFEEGARTHNMDRQTFWKLVDTFRKDTKHDFYQILFPRIATCQLITSSIGQLLFDFEINQHATSSIVTIITCVLWTWFKRD